MKNLLIISVVVFACVSCATSQITTAEAPPYISVINVPSASQDVLYRRANSWFVDAFGSAESVIQYQDKEEGIIKGKYSFDIIKKGAWAKTPMLGTITIEVKEGRYRAQFSVPQLSNVEYESVKYPLATSLYSDDSLNYTYGEIKKSWAKVLSQLESAMAIVEEEW